MGRKKCLTDEVEKKLPRLHPASGEARVRGRDAVPVIWKRGRKCC